MVRARKAQVRNIPEKLFFKIGEVAEIAGIKPHVLRFWESEFGMLRPVKSRTGHRVYRKKDLETVLQIRKLLYEEGYTISGAKKKLFQKDKSSDSNQEALSSEEESDQDEKAEFLNKLKDNLLSILEILNNHKSIE